MPNILNIYAGFRQTYILCEENTIFCTGSNKFLEFGQSTKEPIQYIPTRLIDSDIKSQIQKLAIGQKHVIAIDLEGDLYGWGSNKFGQLGFENDKKDSNFVCTKLAVSNVKDISCGWSHSLVLLGIFSWLSLNYI